MDNNNELIERPSWWKRNWKWAMPVGGCLTVIIITIILFVGGIFALADQIKTSTGSDEALLDAQQNPEIIAILGEPIESNGFGQFNVFINNGVKTSNSLTPIKGPKGEGVIQISSREENGKTVYDLYIFTAEGSDEVIDLTPRKDAIE